MDETTSEDPFIHLRGSEFVRITLSTGEDSIMAAQSLQSCRLKHWNLGTEVFQHDLHSPSQDPTTD